MSETTVFCELLSVLESLPWFQERRKAFDESGQTAGATFEDVVNAAIAAAFSTGIFVRGETW